jgi:hypothetical protein
MVAQFRSLSFFAVVLAVGFGWISVPPRASAEDAKTALPEYRTWIGDFDEMQKRRLIRIIVPYSKTIFFIDKGEQLGTQPNGATSLINGSTRASKQSFSAYELRSCRRPANSF